MQRQHGLPVVAALLEAQQGVGCACPNAKVSEWGHGLWWLGVDERGAYPVKYMMQRRSCAAVKLTAMPRETQRNRAKNNRRNDAILVVWMAKANEKGMSRR